MDDMATQVLPDVETRPEGTDTTGNDEPKMFHYVRKNKIAESAVLGNMVVALCGETFPVTRSPKPGSPVCPDCKKIYESLRPGGDDSTRPEPGRAGRVHPPPCPMSGP
jgi:hypothetical protein